MWRAVYGFVSVREKTKHVRASHTHRRALNSTRYTHESNTPETCTQTHDTYETHTYGTYSTHSTTHRAPHFPSFSPGPQPLLSSCTIYPSTPGSCSVAVGHASAIPFIACLQTLRSRRLPSFCPSPGRKCDDSIQIEVSSVFITVLCKLHLSLSRALSPSLFFFFFFFCFSPEKADKLTYYDTPARVKSPSFAVFGRCSCILFWSAQCSALLASSSLRGRRYITSFCARTF